MAGFKLSSDKYISLKRFFYFSWLFFFVGMACMTGQTIVRNGVHLGAGSSHFAAEGPFNGCGTMVNAGWQKTMKSQTLRFSPDLTIGFYNNNCVDTAPVADYTTITARAIVNHDFIQSRNFAAFIGGGVMFNYSFGDILGNSPIDPHPAPVKETQFHPGLAANVGLRFLPGNGRLGLELLPVNVQFDFSDYAELIFQARFFYSLDARKSAKTEIR